MSAFSSENNSHTRVNIKEANVISGTMNFYKFCQRNNFVGFSFFGIETTSNHGILGKKPRGLPSDWININKSNIHREHKAFAVRTGSISGITVLDVDNKDTYNTLIRDFPLLINTLTIKTPRGFHIYCMYEPSLISNTHSFKSYPNVDIRSDNAIVFGPFTTYRNIITGKTEEYQIANRTRRLVNIPLELINDVKQKASTTKTSKIISKVELDDDLSASTTQAPHATHNLQTIERLIKFLPRTYLTSYQTWFRTGAIIFHESSGQQSGKDLFFQLSRLAPGYEKVDEKDIENAWKAYQKAQGREKGQKTTKATIATLYFDLKEYDEKAFNTLIRESIPNEPLFD